jgi:hypothetical protein
LALVFGIARARGLMQPPTIDAIRTIYAFDVVACVVVLAFYKIADAIYRTQTVYTLVLKFSG